VRLRFVLAALAGALSLAAASNDPSERLQNPAQEAHARELFRQVRCLVCQNESIDDSEAPLAADLRKIIRTQVQSGASDADIKRFLTDRYGEFVLMRPAFSLGNAALWGVPFLVVVAGFALLIVRLRNRAPDETLSAAERARVAELSQEGPP
jgi:cytochrome c-type biogenesis protein CcmH